MNVQTYPPIPEHSATWPCSRHLADLPALSGCFGRITGDSYIGGLPFRVEGSPLSSIAANGS
jgi:hypothetical protein